MDPTRPSQEPEWTPEQQARVAKAMAVQKAGRRSFLRSGVLSTIALTGVMTLTPREARAHSSAY